MRALLDERAFPVEEVRFFASARSAPASLPPTMTTRTPTGPKRVRELGRFRTRC